MHTPPTPNQDRLFTFQNAKPVSHTCFQVFSSSCPYMLCFSFSFPSLCFKSSFEHVKFSPSILETDIQQGNLLCRLSWTDYFFSYLEQIRFDKGICVSGNSYKELDIRKLWNYGSVSGFTQLVVLVLDIIFLLDWKHLKSYVPTKVLLCKTCTCI